MHVLIEDVQANFQISFGVVCFSLQVREMEEIIKRRYPNSLPALIYAAASAPGHAQPVTTESPRKQSPTYAFLENRVKKLETELENKDEEASKRIRCVEQKYNALRMEYEDRIKDLEKDLQGARELYDNASRANTRVELLEEEMQTVREGNEERVQQLQTEVQVLQDALSKVTAADTSSGKTSRRRKLELEKRTGDDVKNMVQSLQEKLEKKELELEDLRHTCNRLQREREQMLASEGKRVDQQTSPTPDPFVQDLEQENRRLKEQVSHMSLDMDQQRVRFQASLAETERSVRLAREEAADQVASAQAQHKREIDQLKAEFAVYHGSSKVAELKSQLAGQDIVIQRLKAKMADASANTEAVAAARVSSRINFKVCVLKYAFLEVVIDQQCHDQAWFVMNSTFFEKNVFLLRQRKFRDREYRGVWPFSELLWTSLWKRG